MHRTSWFKFAAYLVSAGMVLSLAPAVASAAALTDAQVSSVVSLLQSFGVDSSTIAHVQATLSGKVSSGEPSHGSGDSNHGSGDSEHGSDHGSVPPTVCHCPMIPANAASSTGATGTGCACGGVATSSPAIICRIPTKDLDRGSKGDDVSDLQVALGMSTTTGFFGPMTHSAVAEWQSEHGLPSTGYVGAMTRAKLSEHCGKPVPTPVRNSLSLSATPSSGAAPLTVSFTTSAGTDATFFISFGDGATSSPLKAQCATTNAVGSTPTCMIPTTSHTYQASGTYQATLSPYVACMFSNPRCMIAVMMVASTTVTVQ